MRTSTVYPLGERALSVTERLEATRRALVLTKSAAGVSSVAVLPGRVSYGEAMLGAVTGGTASCEAPSGRVWSGVTSDVAHRREASGGRAVPKYLAEILSRGLEPGMSVGFSGSVLVGLLFAGIASDSGVWNVSLGMPSMGWDATGSLGVDASRAVYVPKVGNVVRTQALTAVVDDFNVVVVGSSIRLGACERRPLSKWVAVRGSLLLGERWDRRDRVKGEVVAVEGVDRGVGYIRAFLVEVTSGWRRARLRIGACGWVPVQVSDGEGNEAVGRVQGRFSLVEAIPS